jgi:hypothetical protein
LSVYSIYSHRPLYVRCNENVMRIEEIYFEVHLVSQVRRPRWFSCSLLVIRPKVRGFKIGQGRGVL